MSVPQNPSSPTWTGLPVLRDLADGITKIPPLGSPTGANTITVGTPNSVGTLQAASSKSGGVTVQNVGGSVVITGNQIEELPDSPEIERAEQCTCTKRFRMPYDYAVYTLLPVLGRGTILADIYGNTLRILSAGFKRERGNLCVVTIVSESLSFDLPPDEFSIEPVELGTDIMKYPRYFYALMPQTSDTALQTACKQAIIRAVQNYRESPFFPTGNTLNGILSGQVQDNVVSQLQNGKVIITIPNTNYSSAFDATADSDWPIQSNPASISYPSTPTASGNPNPINIRVSVDMATFSTGSPDPVIQQAVAAALEIISKVWRGEDTPYQVALKIRWKSYYYVKPYYNPGGYIENPITNTGIGNPGLPAYFGSPAFDYSVNTIFDLLPLINPQCYSSDGTSTGAYSLSCLRQADVVDYQRTWFGWERSWIVSPQAHWDADLYNQKSRPGYVNYPTYPFGYNTTGAQVNSNQ